MVSSRVLRPIIFLVLILALLFAFGFRVAHPHSGLKSALGPASSSIAFYHHGTSANKGDKLVVSTGKEPKDPALVIVVETGEGFVDIQTGNELQRIPPNQVQGKLIAIVPFIGAILNLVGL